jgi:hypothetical protein
MRERERERKRRKKKLRGRDLWGYRTVYPHGYTWATLDEVAQLTRKGYADL